MPRPCVCRPAVDRVLCKPLDCVTESVSFGWGPHAESLGMSSWLIDVDWLYIVLCGIIVWEKCESRRLLNYFNHLSPFPLLNWLFCFFPRGFSYSRWRYIPPSAAQTWLNDFLSLSRNQLAGRLGPREGMNNRMMKQLPACHSLPNYWRSYILWLISKIYLVFLHFLNDTYHATYELYFLLLILLSRHLKT